MSNAEPEKSTPVRIPELVTVTLTPTQHRLLRDLVHWAKFDLREDVGLERMPWAACVFPEDRESAIGALEGLSDELQPEVIAAHRLTGEDALTGWEGVE